jgi:hypothetical protein
MIIDDLANEGAQALAALREAEMQQAAGGAYPPGGGVNAPGVPGTAPPCPQQPPGAHGRGARERIGPWYGRSRPPSGPGRPPQRGWSASRPGSGVLDSLRVAMAERLGPEQQAREPGQTPLEPDGYVEVQDLSPGVEAA